MKSETTFIYALCEPYPNQHKIRYVGKADDPYRRYEQHCSEAIKCGITHKDRWIQNLQANGKEPQLEILEEIPKVGWQAVEQEYIRVFKAIGFQLVNLTDGGDGVCGYVFTSEARMKMSVSQTGKKQSPELIEKRIAPLRGKKISPERCAKLLAANIGKEKTPETRAKIRAAQLGPKNHNFGKEKPLDVRTKTSNANQGVKQKSSASRFVGIALEKRYKTWRARIRYLGTVRELGCFRNERDAARAYNSAALEIYGPNAKLNVLTG